MPVMQSLLKKAAAHPETKFDYICRQLSRAFPDLSRETSPAWQAIIGNTSLLEIPADLGFLQPNSPCEQLLLLLEGRMRVYQHTPDDRELTLYRLNPGDLCVLSINSLMQRKSFSAFAKTETPAKVLVMSKEQFYEARAVSAIFREYVLLSLTGRFHELMEMMELTIFEGLDTRLICILGRMSRTSGSDTIHLTHQELAWELGTSREVISRLLKGLERKGCISLGRGSIRIKV